MHHHLTALGLWTLPFRGWMAPCWRFPRSVCLLPPFLLSFLLCLRHICSEVPQASYTYPHTVAQSSPCSPTLLADSVCRCSRVILNSRSSASDIQPLLKLSWFLNSVLLPISVFIPASSEQNHDHTFSNHFTTENIYNWGPTQLGLLQWML